jgi:hypothetical protein
VTVPISYRAKQKEKNTKSNRIILAANKISYIVYELQPIHHNSLSTILVKNNSLHSIITLHETDTC